MNTDVINLAFTVEICGQTLSRNYGFSCVAEDDQGDLFVDLAPLYFRTSMSKEQQEFFKFKIITTDSPHEEVRQHYRWTSYGKLGNEPAKTLALMELDTDHIHAIIETQTHLPQSIVKVFENELKHRSIN